MDDRRFDDLTKLLGRRASRRAVFKGIATTALAAVVGRAALSEQVASAAPPTQGGVKQRVKKYCNAAGQACKNSLNPTRRCCYRCSGSGKQATCCEAKGYACSDDGQCCDGRICRDPNLSDGVHLKGCFDSGTLPVGAECRVDGECATGVCASGACCDPTAVCNADPYIPGSGECCDPSSEVCTTDDGCCPFASVCYNNRYGTTSCCDPETQACIDVAPQSGDYRCVPWP